MVTSFCGANVTAPPWGGHERTHVSGARWLVYRRTCTSLIKREKLCGSFDTIENAQSFVARHPEVFETAKEAEAFGEKRGASRYVIREWPPALPPRKPAPARSQ